MSYEFELSRLDPFPFEHMVNQLAMRVLGAGHTGFGPGPDGGRDGYFEGEAPYPSTSERWCGIWYIQSKFHAPHISKDPQKWLLEQIQKEIKAFKDPVKERTVPNNWIVATNINPSAGAGKGTFDKARHAVAKAFPIAKVKFHIWGGQKILDLLSMYPEVGDFYRHYLTPGHVLSVMYNHFEVERVELDAVLNYLIGRQFADQQHTKLEQAGSDADSRPGIHRLFIDVPFHSMKGNYRNYVLETMVRAAARRHLHDPQHPEATRWRTWNRHPSRARVWFIKGGPGQGKSTIGQYFAQIQRAAHIIADGDFPVKPAVRELANEVKEVATKEGFWPAAPRIPVSIELKDYAQWFSKRSDGEPKGILSYLANQISKGVEQKVSSGLLKKLLSQESWFFAFDGLDEVPHDVKDRVAHEVGQFLDHTVLEVRADVFSICTSRPQGYSGQFDELDGPRIHLANLDQGQALKCAKPVLSLGRTAVEAKHYYEVLKSAITSIAVRELMTTPLQAHIMAVVVRDGGAPPERRWELFRRFYDVIKRREANRDLPNAKLAKLLRAEDQLLKTVHSRLGFVLHSRAETSQGAITNLSKSEFRQIVAQAVALLVEDNVDDRTETVMEATAERLVLVNTPDDGHHVRFDVRQLQEFFAAEFIYERVDVDTLHDRMNLILGDSHWTEVSHFLLSALIANDRISELAVGIQILNKLDDTDPDVDQGFLRKRLARGSILAAKLLQEGVLEQDKGIRQSFKRTLGPLLGTIHTDLLGPLASTHQPQSRAWLTDVLFDHLRSTTHQENIGAAITLMPMIDDDHPGRAELEEYLLAAPPLYTSLVFAATNHRWRTKRPHNWLVRFWLQQLLSDDLKRLNTLHLNQMFGWLKKSDWRDIAIDLHLDEICIEYLKIFFRERVGQVETSAVVEDFGVAKINYFDTRPLAKPEKDKLSKLISKTDCPPGGFLDFARLILQFAIEPSNDHVLQLVEAAPPWADWIKMVPLEIRRLLPLNSFLPYTYQLSLIREVVRQNRANNLELDLGSFLREAEVRNVVTSGVCSLDQWQRIAEEFPAIALGLWVDSGLLTYNEVEPRPACLNKSEFHEILIGSLIKHPMVLLCNPNAWHDIFSLSVDGVTELRKKMLNLSESDVSLNGFRRPEFKPLRLNLPQEKHLLVPLARYLGSTVISFEHDPSGEGWGFVPGDFASQKELLQLALEKDETIEIRAAALVLALGTSSNRLETAELYQELIVTFIEHVASTWFLNCLASLFSDPAMTLDPRTQRIIGKILEKTSPDFRSRLAFSGLIRTIRETSLAPVTQSSVIEKWLSFDRLSMVS